LPDLPTIAETLPGYEMLSWGGLMVPAKTSKAIIDTLHKAAVSTLSLPDTGKRLKDLGFVPVATGGKELAAYLKVEIERYAKLIRQIGLPQQ
ncbi:MAG TPA: tripartite tricarboxylate transporter substrate-binding protein, partial [Burkholderiales bacterium]|nr:tripartite tricarboxylate transporter substrate-binding protein [Burkholderiales bacterium]